ncbi:unnamed protein product [Rangifer tarandus platyrhynchus]|uniref:Uncharacterized protein n=1 Tax=Rangifer tarandus platyrhynchus TaxID=3082113 RepID=A0AC59ZW94_RANTA
MTQEMTVFVLGTRHSIPRRALILPEIDGVPGGGQLSGSRSSAPTKTLGRAPTLSHRRPLGGRRRQEKRFRSPGFSGPSPEWSCSPER